MAYLRKSGKVKPVKSASSGPSAYPEIRNLLDRNRARGGDSLGAVAVIPQVQVSCPNCGNCGFDGRNAKGTVELLHCPSCGRWSPANTWSACGPVVIDTYPDYYPVFYGGRRGGGGHGGGHHGGGHHGHHGVGLGNFWDVPQIPLPPMPAPGAADEQVALLRRVAANGEQFNAQDLQMRRVQIAATVALPVIASIWAWGWGWWNKRRSGT